MNSEHNRFLRSALIALFFAAVSLPFLQMQLRFFKEFDNMENRELAPFPSLSRFELGQFPAAFDAFARDHFGFRPDLIRWNCILRVGLLGVSPIPSVILGSDSWLFYCAEALSDGNTLNDFRGTIPLSLAELQKLQRQLENNQREFSRRNIPYLVVIAPNKSTIYAEFMPSFLRKARPLTRLDQLTAHLTEHRSVKILDLRETLMRAKSRYPVYWKTDSHWNSYGAYAGYREIVQRLSEYLPKLQPLHLASKGVEKKPLRQGGDLAQMLYMQDLLPETNDTEVHLAHNPEEPPLGTIIFRHDSFGDNLYPFLRRHFRKIVNIAPFAPFRFEAIEAEQPKAVLHLFVERYITQALHDNFFYREDFSEDL